MRGGRKIRRNFRRVQKAVEAALVQALDDVADDLHERAQAIAPQLSGELIGTSDVIGRGLKNPLTRNVVFFTVYAVKMHEDVYNLGPISSQKSATSDGPVGRKYLERPFKKHEKRWIKEIGLDVGRAVRLAVR